MLDDDATTAVGASRGRCLSLSELDEQRLHAMQPDAAYATVRAPWLELASRARRLREFDLVSVEDSRLLLRRTSDRASREIDVEVLLAEATGVGASPRFRSDFDAGVVQ
jgi:hypothetical protein